ncbi:MAG: DsbE family thiol:disulfide interchange protein [Parasphingorhabdus sp.]|uniref:DsbE family thiol:disulfide interchange protein n=1 Tax=Parasphingorhabdus sp. TaxID=2709688 RepID=UPI00329893AA
MNRWLLWLPLALFGLFFAAVAVGLMMPKDNIIESKMVGKPMPAFTLPAAVEQRPGLSSNDLADGKPKLLNIFASWCVPCIAEAPQLLALEKAGVEIHAIASRDTPQDIANFLNRWGNPYSKIGSDTTSSVQLELGSSGVPETFVIDGNGIIVHQHIGDIRKENVPELLKILEESE